MAAGCAPGTADANVSLGHNLPSALDSSGHCRELPRLMGNYLGLVPLRAAASTAWRISQVDT